MIFNNYWLEGAALLLNTIILYMLLSRKSLILKYSKEFIKVFLSAYYAAFFGLGQAIVEGLVAIDFISGADSIPYVTFFCYGFFIAHMLCFFFFATYEHAVLDIEIKSLSSKLILYIPTIVSLFLILTNPISNQLFSFDEFGVYQRESLLSILYVIGIYYYIYVIFIINKYGKNIKNDKSKSFTYLPLIPIIGTVTQIFLPQYYVENFAISIMLLLVYVAIERPTDYIDAVTGLQNSEAFYTNFNISMNMNKPVTLLVVNVKNIDAWDREIGSHTNNMLLVDIAGFLTDVASKCTVYCIDRGLFVVYVNFGNSWVNESESSILVTNIYERFKVPFSIKGYKIVYSETTCVLNCPEEADNELSLHELIKLSTLENYNSHKSIIKIEDLMSNSTDKEQLIASKIKTIQNNDNLRLLFLPEYNNGTKSFDSVKTDLTLFISELGPIRPNVFIPIAERNGLIDDLNDYILETLFRQISKNNLDKIGIKNINIIMPTSVLVKINETNHIIDLAKKYNIPPSLICFELAKNALTRYEGRITLSMQSLTQEGFKFSLENYGSGYTNAASLIELPIYNVTLDKKLTNAALTSEIANNLVKCTINFLKDFGFKVKAEHIEHSSSKNYASYSGFDYMQGYYFSSPLTARELVEFLKGQ